MSDPLFHEIVHRQFVTLVRSFPSEARLVEFLKEVPIPERVGPLIKDARDVAEMLLAAPTEQFAAQELRADEARTRAFYQFAMSQFHTLREVTKGQRCKVDGTPFYELSIWILGLTAQRD